MVAAPYTGLGRASAAWRVGLYEHGMVPPSALCQTAGGVPKLLQVGFLHPCTQAGIPFVWTQCGLCSSGWWLRSS